MENGNNTEHSNDGIKIELEDTRRRLREEIERKLKLLQYIEGLQEYIGELESTVQQQAQQIQQQENALKLYTRVSQINQTFEKFMGTP